MTTQTLNSLSKASSAYLRSAMHQPIQWNEWGEEAFATAQAGKQAHPARYRCGLVPLVSRDGRRVVRGPRSWRACVNERSSAVKVDRDERPDIDARYQGPCSRSRGQGGWPLTAFLTPSGKAFYGGTYFPPDGQIRTPQLQARSAVHRGRLSPEEHRGGRAGADG